MLGMPRGLLYLPNFITDKQQEYIVNDLDHHEWSNELKRRVQHYGYKYDYTQKTIKESMKVEGLLDWMLVYGKKFRDSGYFHKFPDQAIVNEYMPGQGIYKHIDCEPCFGEAIASLSLLSPCIMEFSRVGRKFDLLLEPKSLLILRGEARNLWYHGIPARLTDGETVRERRISVTFRTVKLEGVYATEIT